MGANDLSEMWNLVRENEKSIAILKTKLDANDATLNKLVRDNEAMCAILNKAIGARTVVGVIGAIVGAAITWVLAYLSLRNGGAQ